MDKNVISREWWSTIWKKLKQIVKIKKCISSKNEGIVVKYKYFDEQQINQCQCSLKREQQQQLLQWWQQQHQQ